jgi:hypothetical protein
VYESDCVLRLYFIQHKLLCIHTEHGGLEQRKYAPTNTHTHTHTHTINIKRGAKFKQGIWLVSEKQRNNLSGTSVAVFY